MQQTDWRPAYVRLAESGELAQRAKALYAFFRSCQLCPRRCRINRLKGETGVCGATSRVQVASAHPHFGEETPLVGSHGSGTIFFSHCNLLCAYCQNWQISHGGEGALLSDEGLGRMMLRLQDLGCHNINLVTPTHYAPNIVQALRSAAAAGLRIPLVYNCGGYEPLEALELLDGIVDIYLADFKYADPCMAERYSRGARDYPEVAAAAIAEMRRQVGDLTIGANGVARRGLMIRHLVLPDNIAGTDRFVSLVAEKLAPSTFVNLMSQYRPAHEAFERGELGRRIARQEYARAVEWAREAGLANLGLQNAG
jgi:putative pyruvate formate lyase activating enzyme